jgi:hypothetical protein
MNYVVLYHVDPEQKRARYYALTWCPSLIGGGWAIERVWGPLSSQRRQRKTTVVEDRDTALHLVTRHLRRRLQHGYSAKEMGGDGSALIAEQDTGRQGRRKREQ